jgi:Fe-S-cluster containining protein
VLTGDEVLKLITNVKKEYGREIDLQKYFRKARGDYGVYFAAKIIKGQCIFLNREKRCIIYKCRPTLCELYPVVDIDAVDSRCPQENKLSHEFLTSLKKRYANEIDEKIKMEQTFRFI